MVEPTFNYDNHNLVNYQTASALIELFDMCYKQGVVHAYQLDDINEARNFLSEHRKPGHYATLCDTDLFGRITEGRVYSRDKWRMVLSFWARKTQRAKLIEWYITKAISERNYAGVLYPLCMDFYLQGIAHYIENPILDLTVFVRTRNLILVSNGRKFKHPRRDTDDWLRDIQLSCIERAEVEAQRENPNKAINKAAFDNFAKLFWNSIHGRRGVLRDAAAARKKAQRNGKRKSKDL